MKWVLPLIAALALSAFALAIAMFVIRPRMEVFRTTAGDLRQKVDEVIEEVTEGQAGEP